MTGREFLELWFSNQDATPEQNEEISRRRDEASLAFVHGIQLMTETGQLGWAVEHGQYVAHLILSMSELKPLDLTLTSQEYPSSSSLLADDRKKLEEYFRALADNIADYIRLSAEEERRRAAEEK